MTFYKYDTYGWYAGTCNDGEPRSTEVAPSNTNVTTTPGDLRSNWTGYEWVERSYQPPPQPDYSLLINQHWDAIKQERDWRAQSGGYQVTGKWFHSDTFSRTQQMGLVMMGSGIPGGLQWKTMDGSFVTMTPTLANQIFMAAAQSDTNLFVRAEQLRLLMENDPINFNITEHSWPVMFGE